MDPELRKKILLVAVPILVVLFLVVSFVEEQGAFAVGVLTVGVTAYGVFEQSKNERQDRREEERREREARYDEARRQHTHEAYADILDLWFTVVLGNNQQKKKIAANVKDRKRKQTQAVIPWASDDVICALAQLNDTSENSKPLFAFSQLMLAIRQDLGHSNSGVDSYTIAKLFINDLTPEKWEDLERRTIAEQSNSKQGADS